MINGVKNGSNGFKLVEGETEIKYNEKDTAHPEKEQQARSVLFFNDTVHIGLCQGLIPFMVVFIKHGILCNFSKFFHQPGIEHMIFFIGFEFVGIVIAPSVTHIISW